jgi:signal transduction histidine kinase
MAIEKFQFKHFSWLHKVERLVKVLFFQGSQADAVSAMEQLEQQGGFTPVIECVKSLDALQMALASQEWDIVISGAQLPKAAAMTALSLVKAGSFDLPFIMLCENLDKEFLMQSVLEGADGFLLMEQISRLPALLEQTVRKQEYHKGFAEKAMALEEACKSKELQVTGLVHELKTLMSVEQQVLEFIGQGRFGFIEESQLNVIQELIQSKQQTRHLVENILWLYNEEEYKRSSYFLQADLNELICQDIMPQYADDAKAKHVFLRMDLERNLPKVHVNVMEICFVLKNLLQNALTYTAAGGSITVKTQFLEDYVYCSVEDTGIGIGPEYLETLFITCNPVQSRFRKGAGLGLYLSKKMIDAYGGEIGVQSEVNKGSLFYFKLPVSESEQ